MLRNRKFKQTILGVLVLLIGIIVGFIPFFSKSYSDKNENIRVEDYIDKTSKNNYIEDTQEYKENENVDLLLILEIPKINLKRVVYNFYSDKNTIEKNVMIMSESDLPNVLNGNVILEAHSGNDYISFFNRLNELTVNDEVYIYYQGIKYIYSVDNMYDVDKDGNVEIFRNKNRNTLSLITCKNDNQYKQYVVILYLLKEEEY